MKFVVFWGGLGNQMFEYLYYSYLKRINPNEKIYAYCLSSELKVHNGFELSKWFDVKLIYPNIFGRIFCKTLMFFDKIQRHAYLPFRVMSRDGYQKDSALIHWGCFQDKKYFKSNYSSLRFRSDLRLDEENMILLKKIQETNSVAVHIRRGDYLASAIRDIYGGICTPAYYQKAINTVLENVPNATFFFFSDDTAYIEQNFNIEKKVVVSCNKGEKSFFDMYLMAHCKHMILANSTFSCMAAYLNTNVQSVYCPNRWTNLDPSPDLILEKWTIVNS